MSHFDSRVRRISLAPFARVSHVDSRVKEISLDTFASGLSKKHLIVSGFNYPEWTEEDVRPPEAAVDCGYNNAVIAIVNSNKSCRKAWERSVEDNKSNPSILVQDRLNPENYTEDDERAAALLNLPNVSAVIVHDAAGSWQVMAALHKAVTREHPDDNRLAYRAKESYPNSRGNQTARELGMEVFSEQINASRTPVPQDNLPEIPGFEFSESCRIYVPSR